VSTAPYEERMKIAVLPGDGIGKEIVAEAVKVLRALGERFEFEFADVAGAAYDACATRCPKPRSSSHSRPTRCCSVRSATGSTTSSSAHCARNRPSSDCASTWDCSPTSGPAICYAELDRRGRA